MPTIDENPEKPLDKINRAIQQSSNELKRLSFLYKLRGKDQEARKIDDTLNRLDKRTQKAIEAYSSKAAEPDQAV